MVGEIWSEDVLSGIRVLTTFTQYKVIVNILLFLIPSICRKICRPSGYKNASLQEVG